MRNPALRSFSTEISALVSSSPLICTFICWDTVYKRWRHFWDSTKCRLEGYTLYYGKHQRPLFSGLFGSPGRDCQGCTAEDITQFGSARRRVQTCEPRSPSLSSSGKTREHHRCFESIPSGLVQVFPKHLPFAGNGTCEEAQYDPETETTRVHCLGPRIALARGQVGCRLLSPRFHSMQTVMFRGIYTSKRLSKPAFFHGNLQHACSWTVPG